MRLRDDLRDEQRQREGGVEDEFAVWLRQGGFFLERASLCLRLTRFKLFAIGRARYRESGRKRWDGRGAAQAHGSRRSAIRWHDA